MKKKKGQLFLLAFSNVKINIIFPISTGINLKFIQINPKLKRFIRDSSKVKTINKKVYLRTHWNIINFVKKLNLSTFPRCSMSSPKESS